MAHPAASSSHPAQISALDGSHAGDKAPKEKKAKPVNTSNFPLEVRLSSLLFYLQSID